MIEDNKTDIVERECFDDRVYQGRPIIHYNSSVNGGVYLGKSRREAIVVDSDRAPSLINLYRKAKERATEDGKVRKSRVLRTVYNLVREAMPIQNNQLFEELIRKKTVQDYEKILLGTFLREGIGVSQHDALACASLLESFRDEGHIGGKANVNLNSSELGENVWCRYTTSTGEVFILDVWQNYFGRLSNFNKVNYQISEDF